MIDQRLLQHLKKYGYYTTPERAKLFDVLKSQQSPRSIKELVRLTKEFMNETTVYRNLDLFEEIGIVLRVYTGWKYKIELSDTYSSHHHHMTCTNCHQVISFHEPPSLVHELEKLEVQHGFRSSTHSLELRGLCSGCC